MDFEVQILGIKGKIYNNIIKGVTHINYELDRIYKSEKKQIIPKRTTIGKCCEDDPGIMCPYLNYLKFFPDAALPYEIK